MEKTCCQCGISHDYKIEELKIDYSGLGYIAKLGTCPHCGQINIIKYIEDDNLDINNDERYYKYK